MELLQWSKYMSTLAAHLNAEGSLLVPLLQQIAQPIMCADMLALHTLSE